LGGLIFNSGKGPREMARAVVEKVAEVKRGTVSGRGPLRLAEAATLH